VKARADQGALAVSSFHSLPSAVSRRRFLRLLSSPKYSSLCADDPHAILEDDGAGRDARAPAGPGVACSRRRRPRTTRPRSTPLPGQPAVVPAAHEPHAVLEDERHRQSCASRASLVTSFQPAVGRTPHVARRRGERVKPAAEDPEPIFEDHLATGIARLPGRLVVHLDPIRRCLLGKGRRHRQYQDRQAMADVRMLRPPRARCCEGHSTRVRARGIYSCEPSSARQARHGSSP